MVNRSRTIILVSFYVIFLTCLMLGFYSTSTISNDNMGTANFGNNLLSKVWTDFNATSSF
jgi:hypothetical protein